MGTLRLLLAISIVAGHSAPIFGWLGMKSESVQAFFILSGFYMALILHGGRYATTADFYKSRALRLLPIYWAMLLIYAALVVLPSIPDSGLSARLTHAARSRVLPALDGSEASWLTAIPNLVFFGAEWVRQFLFDSEGHLHFWRVGMRQGPNLRGVEAYLVMPQIWSLGVEVTFYALVPFLVRLSTRWLVLSLAAIYVVGHVAQGTGAGYTGPFANYHMLPVQNGWLFLLGMLCFRCLPLTQRLPPALNVALALVPFVFLFVWAPTSWEQINAMLAVFALGLPSLFALSKDWAWDRWLGEFTYPLYITHFLFAWPSTLYGQYAGLVCLTISAALSFLLMRYVQEPIDRYRLHLARPAIA